jgi:fructose-bisphosphate aldolase / 2-amino-3,7-dideoxy-D-threo-hept-6-ulosonate synthase
MTLNTAEARPKGLLGSDGKGVLVAFDHALGVGPSPGSEYPAATLERIVEGGADGVLVSPGVRRRFADILDSRIKIILSIPTDPKYVEYAASSGCAGVKTTFFGDVRDPAPFRMMEDVAIACHSLGIQYLDEVVASEPGTTRAIRDDLLVQLAARKAAELGADVVKTSYSATKEGFGRAVSTTFIPVVILGGEMADDVDLLQMTKDSVDSGGAGVAYGRNVWGRKNPKTMVQALRAIVHDGKTVRDALAILDGT